MDGRDKAGIYLKEVIWGIVILLCAFLVYRFYPTFSSLLDPGSAFSIYIKSLGLWGPVILILLHIIYNMGGFILFPGPGITLVGVYLYGPFVSFVTNLIGSTLGTTAFFFMARMAGRERAHGMLKKLSGHKDLMHFEQFFEKHEKMALLVSRVVPVFPSEIVTVFCGVTDMDAEDFILINFIGFIPRLLIENYFFEEMKYGFSRPAGKIMLIVGVALAAIYLLRHRIKQLLIRLPYR